MEGIQEFQKFAEALYLAVVPVLIASVTSIVCSIATIIQNRHIEKNKRSNSIRLRRLNILHEVNCHWEDLPVKGNKESRESEDLKSELATITAIHVYEHYTKLKENYRIVRPFLDKKYVKSLDIKKKVCDDACGNSVGVAVQVFINQPPKSACNQDQTEIKKLIVVFGENVTEFSENLLNAVQEQIRDLLVDS